MEIQILPHSVVVKLSKTNISQLHVSSCAVGLHQLTHTVLSRQLFLDIVVQMEEVTLQASSHLPVSTSLHSYSLSEVSGLS